MSLIVKAFLESNGNVKGEIRRFQVTTKSDLYQQLRSKVAEVFGLADRQFRMFWQDPDGDFVIFSSSDELNEAMTCSKDGILRLFVKTNTDLKTGASRQGKFAEPKPRESNSDETVFHPGVICDGCDRKVYGPRYKCVICFDYDLCSACELKGIHPEHDKLKITHPQTGGHGAFVPPHFCRWMHHMKKWHEDHGSQRNTCTGGTTSSANNKEQRDTANEDEYLKDIGANVAALLDPFGINVTYEVQHGNQPRQRHYQNGGHCGEGQRTGHPGPWGFDMFSGACPQFFHSQRTNMSSEKPPEKSSEKSEEKITSDARDADLVTILENVTVTDSTSPAKDVSPARSSDEDWAMVHDGEVALEGEGQGSVPSLREDGLYPNLQVIRALETMKSMGFTDEDGWLTRLLEHTGGDISRALDTLKLGAEQANRLSS